MNIIVCIKQVPDANALSKVRIEPKTKTLLRHEVTSLIINPFDENAIEEALRLRERHGGKVTAITMGPPQAESALRRALAMGVDEAVLITDPALAGSDTLATSYVLSTAIRKIGEFDLILLGKHTIDGDTAQVGPQLAEQLGLPQIICAQKIEVKDNVVKAESSFGDFFEVVEASLPAVLTVTDKINKPRRPPMRGVLKARRAEIFEWGLTALNLDSNRIGLDGSPTRVVELYTPRFGRKKKEMLTGSISMQIDTLLNRLKEDGII
jgi:electron transfer flavoprotein beta subunit